MCLFSSRFESDSQSEARVMCLDTESADFAAKLSHIIGRDMSADDAADYRSIIGAARDANLPVKKRTLAVDDLFPKKAWRGLALVGYMQPDPYCAVPGVEEVEPGVYRVVTRASTRHGIREVTFKLRLMESFDETRRVFSPLLDRFYDGEDYRERAVKVSDSGRIRNELQTWCSEACEFVSGDDTVRLVFEKIDESVLSANKQRFVREVLTWYKQHHPMWFRWLELV